MRDFLVFGVEVVLQKVRFMGLYFFLFNDSSMNTCRRYIREWHMFEYLNTICISCSFQYIVWNYCCLVLLFTERGLELFKTNRNSVVEIRPISRKRLTPIRYVEKVEKRYKWDYLSTKFNITAGCSIFVSEKFLDHNFAEKNGWIWGRPSISPLIWPAQKACFKWEQKIGW